MDNEFEHVSAIDIASSLRTDGCLYTGNHDTSNIEWLSNSINHDGTRILQQQDGRLRTTYSALKLPWFQTFIDKLVEDGWLMYNHGYIERVIKTLDDKTFYQIRAWLVSGAVTSKAPIFLTIMIFLVRPPRLRSPSLRNSEDPFACHFFRMDRFYLGGFWILDRRRHRPRRLSGS